MLFATDEEPTMRQTVSTLLFDKLKRGPTCQKPAATGMHLHMQEGRNPFEMLAEVPWFLTYKMCPSLVPSLTKNAASYCNNNGQA